MSNNVIFTDGMIAKRRDNAPDFVLCNLSIKVDEFINFLQKNQHNGWVNVDVKKSKQGKIFSALNTWRPNNDAQGAYDNGLTNQIQNNNGQSSNSFDQRFPPAQDGDEIPF